MRIFSLILIASIFLSGCFYSKQMAVTRYNGFIHEWQERVKKEGWSKNLVDDVVSQYLSNCTLNLTFPPKWPTLSDSIEAGFKGSCASRASGLYSTLKFLDCPYKIGNEFLATPLCYHVCLVVQFEPGKWTRYETVPYLTLADRPFYKRLFIFDENEIYL